MLLKFGWSKALSNLDWGGQTTLLKTNMDPGRMAPERLFSSNAAPEVFRFYVNLPECRSRLEPVKQLRGRPPLTGDGTAPGRRRTVTQATRWWASSRIFKVLSEGKGSCSRHMWNTREEYKDPTCACVCVHGFNMIYSNQVGVTHCCACCASLALT